MHSNRKEKSKSVRIFVIGLLLNIIFYSLFSFMVVFTDLLSNLTIRYDFLGYLIMGAISYLFGFIHGYKTKEKEKDIDTGAFFGLLFFITMMQVGVFIFDNIVIVMRVHGPEKLNLNAPMELQFIFIYFLTISQYRFFTIIYLISGAFTLLYVRKRSTLVLACLFTTYIYSSLFLGYIFNLPINISNLDLSHILFYILMNLSIGILFLIVFIIIRFKLDKSFEIS